MLLFFGIVISRLSVKYLFSENYNFKKKTQFLKKILIYGAGRTGQEVAAALKNSNELKVVGFLDDNNLLRGGILQGQNIYSPLELLDLIKIKQVQSILLAFPTIGKKRRNEILKNLSKYELEVKTVPTVADIVQGRVSFSDIKDLDVDDILNRDQVLPNSELLTKNITSKVVLVTGAGGDDERIGMESQGDGAGHAAHLGEVPRGVRNLLEQPRVHCVQPRRAVCISRSYQTRADAAGNCAGLLRHSPASVSGKDSRCPRIRAPRSRAVAKSGCGGDRNGKDRRSGI
jgi:hypothetical protein